MATTVDTHDAALTASVRGRRVPRIARWQLDVLAALICLGLALIAQRTLPSLPSYDPFSWIVWGHEIARHVAGGHVHVILRGGPSWKPLPVIFTTIFGFFGGHAVACWIVFCRAAGLYALYLAMMVGARVGASRPWAAAGPIAGVLAGVAVLLMLDWLHFMFRATSEPLTVTAALLWVDWHLRGRRLAALSAGTALALMRPESSALAGLYALWCLWRLPGVWRRIVVLAELALIPAAWVVPPWITEHKPFMSANQARDYTGNHGHNLYTIALHRADFLLMWPVLAGAVAMTLLALWRREWFAVGLAGVCIAYVGIVEVMTIHGYPGLTRFLLPVGAIACVLAGAGVVRLAELVHPVGGGAGAVLLAGVLTAIAVPFCASRLTDFGFERGEAAHAVRGYHALVLAAQRTGGTPGILPCRTSRVAVNHDEQPSLAWTLGVPLNRVNPVTYRITSVFHPTVGFFAPRNTVLGGSPRRLLPGLDEQLVLRERMWRVVRITRHHDARIDACVGAAAARARAGGATRARRRAARARRQAASAAGSAGTRRRTGRTGAAGTRGATRHGRRATRREHRLRRARRDRLRRRQLRRRHLRRGRRR